MTARSFPAVLLGIAIMLLPLWSFAADRPLTNADIVKMAPAFSDATLISMIQTHKDAFDVTPDALLALKKAGIPEDVIRAMIQAMAPSASASSAVPAQSSNTSVGMPQMPPQVQAMMQSMGMSAPGYESNAVQMPDAWFVNGEEKVSIKPSTATLVQHEMQGVGTSGGGSTMLTSLAQTGLGLGAIALGPAGAIASSALSMFSHPKVQKPHMHMVWALPNPTSANVIESAMPTFELKYADIPGIDPDSIDAEIVKLETTKDNWRLVGATDQELTASFMGGAPPADSIVENNLQVHLSTIGRGDAQITPQVPLQPGEYGLVLRPRKDAGSHDLGGPVQTQLFYTVWDFSVTAVEPQPH